MDYNASLSLLRVRFRNRKRACAVSMQWLRGYRADIGAEFSLMADTLGRMETLAVAGGQSIFDTLVHRWGGIHSSS